MAITKLTFAAMTHRRTRVVLTVIAIALSISLVVAVTSGYASAEAAIYKYFTEFMGGTDVALTREPPMPGSLLNEVRSDGRVRTAIGRLELEVPLVDLENKPLPMRSFQTITVIGVRLPEDVETSVLRQEPGTSGAWFEGDAGAAAVIDQEASKLLKQDVGGAVLLPLPKGPLKLKVVGIIHKPAIMAAMQQTIYVPLKTLQEWNNTAEVLSKIRIGLRPGTDSDAFIADWKQKLNDQQPPVEVVSTRETRKELDRDLQSVELLSYVGGAVSMIAAAAIVFSTLSMGVTERQRTLAMLRAVGATKWQVARLVILEGIILALAGAAVGLPLGYLWIKILTTWKSHVFSAGTVISLGGMLFGAGGSLLAALVASIIPAWNATRVDPVEGMTVVGQPSAHHVPLWAALAGLVLICVDPFITHSHLVAATVTYYSHFFIGLPCFVVGFLLIAPAFVVAIETAFGAFAAWAMGVSRGLLAQQLSGSIWRAAGTGAALSVGLAILIVLQTQGNSLLNGWKLPTHFPDMFIFSMKGLDKSQQEALKTVEGIKKDQVLPIVYTTSGLGELFWGNFLMPNATMFLGVDPDLAMQMLELDFRVGNPKDAAEMLKKGRHVIVTEEFRQLKGLTVGDKIKLKTKKNGMVEYTVAGVVWSPGIDVFVSRFDMGRQFRQRSAASVFGSLEDADRDFGESTAHLFAVNLENFVERADIEKRVTAKFGEMGLRAGDVREIKANIVQGFRRLLNVLSTVALSAMAVASLGVTNTIMASIRSRQWQLGVLRSIGVTRDQLLRLILAEALLLGIVGCALGVAAGLLLSFDANGLSNKMIGYRPPIDVPWGVVVFGMVVVLVVALLASIYPAIKVARQDPLSLLQAGRAAA